MCVLQRRAGCDVKAAARREPGDLLSMRGIVSPDPAFPHSFSLVVEEHTYNMLFFLFLRRTTLILKKKNIIHIKSKHTIDFLSI